MKKIPWYRSIGMRLPLIVAICCIVPVLVFSYYNQSQTRQKVMESAKSSIYTNLYGSSLILEQLMESVSGFSTSLAEEKSLVTNIKVFLNSEEQRSWARSKISLQLSQNFSQLRSLNALYLIWEGGDTILSTDLDEKEISVSGGWGQEAQRIYDQNAAGKIAWVYLPEMDGHGGLCYLRPVDLGGEYGKCSLVCEVSKDYWQSAVSSAYAGSNMYICDYSGHILLESGSYTGDNLREQDMFRDAFENKKNFGTYEYQDPAGVHHLVMYYNSVENGWKYVTQVPVEVIMSDLDSQMRMSYVMILVGIFSAVVAAVYLAKTVISPLRVLDYHMDRMETGDLIPIENIRNKDETGAILKKYNHMIAELGRMIDEIYVQQLLRKQAQLSSLQSQMDEHFLYNTLNMIYCEACKEHADNSARMLHILSRYFRLNLAEGRDKAPLNEIVELIRFYLAIQKARFGEELVCKVETFPDMEQYVALKYLFQPIVENAIVHGFEKRLGDHEIRIIWRRETVVLKGNEEKELLYFEVEDDGNGIPEDKLNRIIQEMHTFEKVEGSGYALKNIREQIRITYGDGYPISIESKPGKGTRVSFRIPLERKCQEGE